MALKFEIEKIKILDESEVPYKFHHECLSVYQNFQTCGN